MNSLTHPADGRRFSLRVNLASSSAPVELAHVAVHGDYFSNRLMIKQQAEPNIYTSLYAVSGTVVNVTRLCAVLLEMYQLENGRIDFKAINSLFTYVIVLFTKV
jgi:seryl-tRNA synthetase